MQYYPLLRNAKSATLFPLLPLLRISRCCGFPNPQPSSPGICNPITQSKNNPANPFDTHSTPIRHIFDFGGGTEQLNSCHFVTSDAALSIWHTFCVTQMCHAK